MSLSSLSIDLRGGTAKVSRRRKPLRNINDQRTGLIPTATPTTTTPPSTDVTSVV